MVPVRHQDVFSLLLNEPSLLWQRGYIMSGSCYDIQQFSIELVLHCKGGETPPLRFNGAVRLHLALLKVGFYSFFPRAVILVGGHRHDLHQFYGY